MGRRACPRSEAPEGVTCQTQWSPSLGRQCGGSAGTLLTTLHTRTTWICHPLPRTVHPREAGWALPHRSNAGRIAATWTSKT
jgi:hypothetical protein